MERKKCSRCERVRPVEDFRHDNRAGLQRYCRPCQNAYMREARRRGKWNKSGGYKIIRVGKKTMKRSRFVMEKILGRKLLRTEIVHHRDENKLNDEPENLKVVNSTEHYWIHRAGRINFK